MSPQTNPLFAEKSLTLVAALFGDGQQATVAAERLRPAQADVEIVQPGDKQWMRKVEPEGPAIRRGAWRSHLTLMLAGAALGMALFVARFMAMFVARFMALFMALGVALGAALSFVLIGTCDAAAASPLLTGIAVSLFATFTGGMLAGLLTLHRDRQTMAMQLRDGLNHGR